MSKFVIVEPPRCQPAAVRRPQDRQLEPPQRRNVDCPLILLLPLKALRPSVGSVTHRQDFASGTDLRIKQKIIRTLIEEIVADIDQAANQVVMLAHWSGGRHTELRVSKPKAGEHNHRTALEAAEVVKQMAGLYPDDVIASTLNRLGFVTGYGNTWRKHLVCSLRSKHNLPNYDPNNMRARGTLTAEQAAERLGVSMRTVRELRTNVLAGPQVVKFASWQIPVDALSSAAVVERVQRIRTGNQSQVPRIPDEDVLRLPGM